jgi:hypothetical protein
VPEVSEGRSPGETVRRRARHGPLDREGDSDDNNAVRAFRNGAKVETTIEAKDDGRPHKPTETSSTRAKLETPSAISPYAVQRPRVASRKGFAAR